MKLRIMSEPNPIGVVIEADPLPVLQGLALGLALGLESNPDANVDPFVPANWPAWAEYAVQVTALPDLEVETMFFMNLAHLRDWNGKYGQDYFIKTVLIWDLGPNLVEEPDWIDHLWG